MYLAFYKANGGLFNKLIRWWSNSNISHVELVRKNSEGSYDCYSSSQSDGGVRMKKMDLPLDRWVICNVNVDETKVVEWFENNLGKKYDWLGIFGMLWKPANDNPNRYFCSECCLAALKYAGWKPAGDFVPSKTDPITLFKIWQISGE